jgi:hypothetical protein
MTTLRSGVGEASRRAARALAAAGLAVLLVGCATLGDDDRFGPIADTATKYTGQQTRWARTASDLESIERRVSELLAQPLTADSAAQIALLNSRGLQVTFQKLGIDEAELMQASRLPDTELSLLQLSVSMEMLQLASAARKAFYDAVAAEQLVRYRLDVKAIADAGAELARRLAQAGNINKLQQAREHGFFSEAALNLARAQQMRTAARERLVRALGLWGQQLTYTLPERLPDLPQEPADQPEIEQLAMAQRLDVRAARLQAEATAKHLGRSARAEALYMQSMHRAAKVAVDARSEVREAYDRYRSAYDIARHYRDDIVPTAKRISDENLLRYNGMLIGVFDLLADARAQIGAVASSIEALREFWVARADLDMAMIGKPSLEPPAGGLGRAADSGPTPH